MYIYVHDVVSLQTNINISIFIYMYKRRIENQINLTIVYTN